jgi:hypothetical protein
MIGRVDAGKEIGLWAAHAMTDVPPRDAFPTCWRDNWGDDLDHVYKYFYLYSFIAMSYA